MIEKEEGVVVVVEMTEVEAAAAGNVAVQVNLDLAQTEEEAEESSWTMEGARPERLLKEVEPELMREEA
jgi:hypothetical protein